MTWLLPVYNRSTRWLVLEGLDSSLNIAFQFRKGIMFDADMGSAREQGRVAPGSLCKINSRNHSSPSPREFGFKKGINHLRQHLENSRGEGAGG